MIFPSGAASYEVTHLISFSNFKCMFTLYANGLKLFSPIEFLTISLTKYFPKVQFFTALGGVFTSNQYTVFKMYIKTGTMILNLFNI